MRSSPSVEEDTMPSENLTVITIKVRNETAQEIKRLADKAGIKPSMYVRKILERQIGRKR